MANYIEKIIPFVPVGAWRCMTEVHYTGHIYYMSPYECDDNCGTCDGARCDTCNKRVSRNIYLSLSHNEIMDILKKVYPFNTEPDFDDVPIIKIEHVKQYYPELYKVILGYLGVPDPDEEAKARAEKREAELEAEKRWHEKCSRKVLISNLTKQTLASLTLDGSLCECKWLEDQRELMMSSSSYRELRSAIPDKLLECLDNNMESHFGMWDKYYYNIPYAWLDDLGIHYAYGKPRS